MAVSQQRWIGVALLLSLWPTRGAFTQDGSVASPETRQHIYQVLNGLVRPGDRADGLTQKRSLTDRMAALHVPGVSIAVIHHGSIDWAQGFGVAGLDGSPVRANTLFQAGSISKPLAAMAVLRLAEEGKLSLDVDVNTLLTSWKLPASSVAEGKPVTLRELLCHTGGLTVHGFPGYEARLPIPTLIQVLDGTPPANSPAIRIEAAPEARWKYSGGGYVIMQQIVVDTVRLPFPAFLYDTVLARIGMAHSTYQQPLPASLRSSAAIPYDGNGVPVPGGSHTYPELAAAGLWTTPSDLARYIIEIQTSLQGKSNHILSADMTRQMLTPCKVNMDSVDAEVARQMDQTRKNMNLDSIEALKKKLDSDEVLAKTMGGSDVYERIQAGLKRALLAKSDWGLGLQLGGSVENPFFLHGGSNVGYESLMVAYERGGEGAVVMTNGQGGSELVREVMQSIVTAYGWPDFQDNY